MVCHDLHVIRLVNGNISLRCVSGFLTSDFFTTVYQMNPMKIWIDMEVTHIYLSKSKFGWLDTQKAAELSGEYLVVSSLVDENAFIQSVIPP